MTVVIDDIPVPVPAVNPPAIPSPGPIIRYLGEGEHAVWDNVFSWVTGSAKKFLGLEGAGLSALEALVLPIVETYVGQLLQAGSGFWNDISDFAATGIEAAIDFADEGLRRLLRDVLGIEDWVSGLQTLLGLVADVAIPALLGEIIRIGGSIDARILGALAGVEAWAIDNIYNPLLEDVVRTAGDLYDAIQATAEWVVAEAEGLVSAETLARIAAIGALAASVAALAEWVAECGAPMCDTFGPKTDLGKFLKALNIAGTAALLAELAALDADGIETLLRGMQALAGGVVDDFEAIFTGGETIGSAIAHTGG